VLININSINDRTLNVTRGINGAKIHSSGDKICLLVTTQHNIDNHRSSDGSEHTFINQDVTYSGNPSFASLPRIGTYPNHAIFDENGFLSFVGGAEPWYGYRIPATLVNVGGVRVSDFSKILDNGEGSTGIYGYIFDDNTEEEVFIYLKAPHSWQEGSTVYPCIQWMPLTDGGSGEKVSWGIEGVVKNKGEIYSTTTLYYANQHDPADDSLVAKKHYSTSFDGIDMTGIDITSAFLVRFFRNATGAGGSTDNYGDDACLIDFVFHYQADTLGSRERGSK
jgi:hypothetical protein